MATEDEVGSEALDTTDGVGARLRQLRRAQGVSGREVAARAGVSPSYLSRLEHGRLSPTVTTLARIMKALGEPLSKAFEDGQDDPVVRSRDRPSFHNRGVEDFLITPRRSGRLEVLETVVKPGCGSGEDPYSHPGDEECIFVLDGEFRVWVDGKRYDLGVGDSITFPCGSEHRWTNPTQQTTRVVWIITPAFWYSAQPGRVPTGMSS
ncbi:MAG: XRE family transcriptional regulator [Solirubrobacteraceae bacterium]